MDGADRGNWIDWTSDLASTALSMVRQETVRYAGNIFKYDVTYKLVTDIGTAKRESIDAVRQ